MTAAPDAEGAAILEAVQMAERTGEFVPPAPPVESAPKKEGSRAAVPGETTPAPKPDDNQPPTDKAGTETTPQAPKPGTTSNDDSPTDSNFTRREKEARRAAPGFKDLETQRSQFAKEMQDALGAFRQQQEQFRREQQEFFDRAGRQPGAAKQPDPNRPRVERGKDQAGNPLTAEDWWSSAERAEIEDGGVSERVAAMRQRARQIEREDREEALASMRPPPQRETQIPETNKITPEEVKAWTTTRDALLKAEPDLLTDNELGNWIAAILRDPSYTSPVDMIRFNKDADGFVKAAKLGRLMRDAASVPALRKETERLGAELAKANKKLGLGGDLTGGADPGGQGGKKFEQMNDAEQQAHMKKLAADADANR